MKRDSRLKFEDKKPPSKLSHAVKAAPLDAASLTAHREIRQYEDENVGLESAHFVEGSVESEARLTSSAIHAQRLRSYRKAQTAQPSSNPLSKWMQRRNIRMQYAAAKAGKTAQSVGQASGAVGKTTGAVKAAAKKTTEFVGKSKKAVLIVGGVGLLLAFLLTVVSSCSVMLEGVASAVAGSSFSVDDADMLGAEAAYSALEADLQDYLDDYENTHDYDEYHYDLDSIGHDPYVLTALLTAWHQGAWTLEEVQDTLQMLFDKQYTLSRSVTTETRYRMETVTDGDGNESEEEVPYTYSICYLTLENFNLSHVPVYILTEEQLSMYATLMGTLGNRPDLFPDSPYVARYTNGYTDYDIPASLLEDEQFAAIITEAEKYLGYPYVWGGYNPDTSFDCSGFVSWVLNHSGWSIGRQGTDSLYALCTRIPAAYARPGDLVFFRGTYDTPGISHVGIYVGNNTMIHCGDPISYTNLNSSYWQAHLAGYGRLP
ncbi:MAG: C40 family peptidase [Acidaminococcaceae bacterium]|nr:C40 family peptidase [Acidaminococcaceae bacterium]